MKRLLLALTITTATITTPTLAADVGVSISVGQPGFYGRIDIGDYPRPQLIYRQPIIVQHGYSSRPPIYLRVPPGHAKHWSKNCHKYNACGEHVYFVRDDWYNQQYVPRYQKKHHQQYQNDYRGNEKHGRQDDRRGRDDHDRHGNGRND